MRGLTMASFQSSKKCPVLNERLTTLVIAGMQCVRTFLRNCIGIMSSLQVVDGISIIICTIGILISGEFV